MKRRKGGFTLTEMLTTVGILAILMAVAIPAIITARNNLKMRELDDTAREIFLAAQNSLTARRAAGAPMKLGTVSDEADYRWLSSSDDDMKVLLSAGSIEGVAAGNHCMIWYDAASATVREVYYAESPLPEQDIRDHDYSDSYNGSHKAERRQEKIGYYDGSDLQLSVVEPLLPPTLTIKNEEELTVTVTVPKAGEYIAAGVRLTVTVEELDESGNVVPNRKRVFSGGETPYAGGTLTLTLDSLENGKHFRDTCRNNITPGANIRVTATLSAPNTGDTTYLPSSVHADTNSLFAGRAMAGGSDTLYIAYARHLQNLEPSVSGLPHSADAKPAYHAVQTAEIVWASGQKLRPICNRSLRGYNGNGNEITSLQVDCSDAAKVNNASGAGLFAFVERAKLENIRLVDPVLTGRDAEHVGALAGILRGSTVSNCQVYATADAAGSAAGIDCGGHAGGLIGVALDNYEITGSSASLPRIESSQSGACIGGLIGYVSGYPNGVVSGCYADTGWMGTDKKWDRNYGMRGNGAHIGGLIGGAQGMGTNWVTDCYALGWFAGGSGGTLVGRIQNVTSISNCYTILQCADGNRYYMYQAGAGMQSIASLSELKTLTGSGWQNGGLTTAYHPDICKWDYPHPMLDLHHYGDWPVQTVDSIKLFQENVPDDQEVRLILVPAGQEKAEFYAQAQNGSTSAMQAVEVGNMDTAAITSATPEYDSATGRTKVTLTFGAPNDPRVTYVNLKADEYTLRAVVVVYDATVTLTGINDTDKTQAESVASTDSSKNKLDTLILRSNAKTGTFTANMAVQPDKGGISTALEKLAPKNTDTFVLSATAEDFAGWDKIRSGDPKVTANGDPGTGANILAPVNGDYYPGADADGKLTVTGAASGTATVSARWAMDEALKADCEVKMAGARALIEKASATGEKGNLLDQKTDYPYRLDLIAEPEEKITLTFEPKLFGGRSGGGTYTWEIRGTSGSTFSSDPETTSPSNNGGVWTYTLEDDSSQATYAVTLTYANSSGERSVDFMTFSVYRAAKKTPNEYDHIQIAKAGGGGTFSDPDAQVEQIHSADYPDVDTLTLQGWVEKAGNTKVKWSVLTEDGWQDVTGHNGPVSVFETKNDVSRMRATVEWLSKEEYQTYNGNATGGAILITGQDANEFEEEFSFPLKAEAVEATGTDAGSASRTVTVTVLPRLQIDPQSAMTREYIDWYPRVISFTASREPITGWTYHWSIAPGVGTSEDALTMSGNGNQTVQAGIKAQNASATLTLTFGPHTASATIGTVSEQWVGDDKTAGFINRDGTSPSTKQDYFLVEKNTARSLDFSWFTSTDLGWTESRLRNDPDADTNHFSMELDRSKQNQDLNDYVTNGTRHYRVFGNNFSYNTASTLTWHLQQRLIITRDKYVPTELYVIGMDIVGDSLSTDTGKVTLEGPGDSTSLTADWSFPEELIQKTADGTKDMSITWTVSNPDLVSFTGAGATDADGGKTAAGEKVTLTAHKYSAQGYTVTLQAVCRIAAVNGRDYTFTKLMEVTVPPQGNMKVTLTPCRSGDVDVEDMKTAFAKSGIAIDLTENSLLAAAQEDGTPVLIRDERFGCSTMYLKAQAALSNGALADLREYFCNVYANEFYADVDTALGADHQTMYIRVTAKQANKDEYILPLHAAIGSAEADLDIHLYNTPTVKLTRGSDDVTNGSIPVPYEDPNLPVTVKAELAPTVYRYGDESKTPLDSIAWELEAPTGYDPSRYLTWTVDEEKNEITVKLSSTGHMPDFRVVIHAHSEKADMDSTADSGYALVFLPEEDPQP